MDKPQPEAHIRLTTMDGRVIERRLADLSQPLRDERGAYRTADGGRWDPEIDYRLLRPSYIMARCQW